MGKLDLTLTNRPEELMKSLKPGAIIRSQPDKDKTILVIALLLKRLGALYQIPNFGDESSVLLADWIYENYQWDRLEPVIRTLKNPPIGNDKNWRLTPDTIQFWMAVELEKESVNREKEINNAKKAGVLNDVDLLLTEALGPEAKEESKREPRKGLVPLTQEEIELEGQSKPYKKPYHPPSEEYFTMRKLHLEWIKANFDVEGNKLPGFMAEEEWLLLNHPPF